MLVASALALRFPAWIWSAFEASYEGGLMASFYNSNLSDEDKKLDFLRKDEEDIKDLAKNQALPFKRLQGSLKWYYRIFFGCQLLALFLWFLTFGLTDLFLDGRFTSYGFKVVIGSCVCCGKIASGLQAPVCMCAC